MKKVRINLRNGVHNAMRKFPLFPSVEDIYFWFTELDAVEPSSVPDVDCVELNHPNEFLEVEWRGCEFAYETQQNRVIGFDFVRLVKARPSQNSSGHIISLHYGWSMGEILPFKGTFQDIVVKRLHTDDAQFNLEKIFQDEKP